MLFHLALYLLTYVDKLPWNWTSDFSAALAPVQHADTDDDSTFVGMCGVFGTPSFNRIQEHIIFPHRYIVHIQGDRVECYRGVVYKITNNGEELLEEHEYFYNVAQTKVSQPRTAKAMTHLQSSCGLIGGGLAYIYIYTHTQAQLL